VLYAALALGALVVALVDPQGSSFYPKCLFHLITGWHCPGCGGLRAVHAGLRGNLVEAIRLNPLLVLLSPVLGYAVLSDLKLIACGHGLPRVAWRPLWCWVLLGLVLAFWVARNVPAYPLTLLAP
jgi:hypothetical protein